MAKYLKTAVCLLTFAALAFGRPVPVSSGGSEGAAAEWFTRAAPDYELLRRLTYDGFVSSLADDADGELIKKASDEVDGCSARLSALSAEIDGDVAGSGSNNESIDRAAADYIRFLSEIADDLAGLFRYYAGVYGAIEPLTGVDFENQSAAELISGLETGLDNALKQVSKLEPPGYLKTTHSDIITRITEFRQFTNVFKLAYELDDPLRIFACVYRMNRVKELINRCEANLQSDTDYMVRQAKSRLDGYLTTLHIELNGALTSETDV